MGKSTVATPMSFSASSNVGGNHVPCQGTASTVCGKSRNGEQKSKIRDAKPSANLRGSFLGHPGAFHFLCVLKNRLFPQAVQPCRKTVSAQRLPRDRSLRISVLARRRDRTPRLQVRIARAGPLCKRSAGQLHRAMSQVASGVPGLPVLVSVVPFISQT